MNEKNSAKAGELSGKEAAPGDEADAVKAAEETADRAEARTDTTPADQADKGADKVGPNSGGSEPTRDQADPADQTDPADRADKTLVAMPPAPQQGSARPTADAASEPDEDQADAATGASEAAREPRDDGAASSTPPSDEQPEEPEEREEQPGEEGKQRPEADAPESPEAPEASAKPDPVSAPAPVRGPDANPESAPAPDPDASDPDPDPARKPPAPSWAARRESDSERTSEFVALKPDLPPPTSPRPVTTAPGPSSSGEKPGSASGDPDRTREFAAPSRADNDRTMALTRPPAPSAAAPATSSGTGDAAGPPPPLDLLAQLTNTPPKAETVGRTVARRIKIWGTLVALLAVVLVAVQALRPLPTPTLKLTGKASHTADGGALSLPWPTEGQAVVDIDGLGRMGSYGGFKRPTLGLGAHGLSP
ncbi:hypothetical protein ACFWW0_19950, partial [Streptomyces violascens]